VLSGIRDELSKVNRLADYDHLQQKVLLPALAYARARELVTQQEEAVLKVTIREGTVKAGDLEAALPGLNANQRTYQIRKLLENRMLQPVRSGARQYTIDFMGSTLLRGVIKALEDEGFIPSALSAPQTMTARG
jgi:Fic family protein